MRTRKEWRSAWALVALHTSMAQVLYAPTATMDTTPMPARRTATTARIGSRVEFLSARARGTTDSTGVEALTLIAGDSAAVVLDSTVAEVGSVNAVGAASLAGTVLDGDSQVAAPAEDLLAAVLDEDPAVVSEEVPWAAGSTAEVGSTAVADAGNCEHYSKDIGTAGSKCCQPFFFCGDQRTSTQTPSSVDGWKTRRTLYLPRAVATTSTVSVPEKFSTLLISPWTNPYVARHSSKRLSQGGRGKSGDGWRGRCVCAAMFASGSKRKTS